MNDRTRLGAAVLGGYLLGRTKKGGMAVRLAMWLNGTTAGGAARDGLRRVKSSPEVNKLLTQAGQPLVDAARNAAVGAVEARLSGLAEGLNRRTSKLLPAAGGEAGEEKGGEKAEGDKAGGDQEAEQSREEEASSGEPQKPEGQSAPSGDDGDPSSDTADDAEASTERKSNAAKASANRPQSGREREKAAS
jgi:hypothetical protein